MQKDIACILSCYWRKLCKIFASKRCIVYYYARGVSYLRNCAINNYQHHTSPLASHATVAISTEYHRHRAMRAVCPTPVSDSIAHFARETPVGSRGRAGVYGPFCTLHHHATPFAISASDPTVHPNPLTYPTHSPDCQRPPPPTQRARDVKLLFKDVSITPSYLYAVTNRIRKCTKVHPRFRRDRVEI